MKNTLSLILLIILCNCSKSDLIVTEENSNISKVAIFKIDYTTNNFEGVTEKNIIESQYFNINSSLQSSNGDFGFIQLYSEQYNDLLFDATTNWFGTGEVIYPSELSIAAVSNSNNPLPLPALNNFVKLLDDVSSYYPNIISYTDIWNSINNLSITQEYRENNPLGKIFILLYKPSISIGAPTEWKWFIFLSNQ
ncbi:MAG: hypothetical protein Wins2KO_12910 [Winogradskyella sp.]